MGIRLMHRFGERGKQYPIKRDWSGRSARRRAFDLFDRGMRPSQVAPLVGISPRTAYRYFQSWKRGTRHQELVYQILRAALKGGSVPPQQFVEALAAVLHLSPERVMEELQKPWGLKRLLADRLHHLDKAAIRRHTLTRLGEP